MFLSYNVSLKIDQYVWWKLKINNEIESDKKIKTLIILKVIFYKFSSHDKCLVDQMKSDA